MSKRWHGILSVYKSEEAVSHHEDAPPQKMRVLHIVQMKCAKAHHSLKFLNEHQRNCFRRRWKISFVEAPRFSPS